MSDEIQKAFLHQPTETKAEDYKDFYSNFSRVGITPYDLTVSFGRLSNASRTTPFPEVILEAAVSMSPYQFKAYVNSLNLILAEWERQFGEINISENFLITKEAIHEMTARQNFKP